jgi:hypothetical protein
MGRPASLSSVRTSRISPPRVNSGVRVLMGRTASTSTPESTIRIVSSSVWISRSNSLMASWCLAISPRRSAFSLVSFEIE